MRNGVGRDLDDSAAFASPTGGGDMAFTNHHKLKNNHITKTTENK